MSLVFKFINPLYTIHTKCTLIINLSLSQIVVILLSFACVLFGTVGAKVAMFLMTSQIRPHKTTAFCNVEIDRSRTYIAEIAGAEQGWTTDEQMGEECLSLTYCTKLLQSGAADRSLGFEDEDLRSSPGLLGQ